MPIQRGGTILRGWCDETETENRNRSLKKNSYPHVKGVVVPEKMKLSLLFFFGTLRSKFTRGWCNETENRNRNKGISLRDVGGCFHKKVTCAAAFFVNFAVPT